MERYLKISSDISDMLGWWINLHIIFRRSKLANLTTDTAHLLVEKKYKWVQQKHIPFNSKKWMKKLIFLIIREYNAIQNVIEKKLLSYIVHKKIIYSQWAKMASNVDFILRKCPDKRKESKGDYIFSIMKCRSSVKYWFFLKCRPAVICENY